MKLCFFNKLNIASIQLHKLTNVVLEIQQIFLFIVLFALTAGSLTVSDNYIIV